MDADEPEDDDEGALWAGSQDGDWVPSGEEGSTD
jgi:hypothetical protein